MSDRSNPIVVATTNLLSELAKLAISSATSVSERCQLHMFDSVTMIVKDFSIEHVNDVEYVRLILTFSDDIEIDMKRCSQVLLSISIDSIESVLMPSIVMPVYQGVELSVLVRNVGKEPISRRATWITCYPIIK